MRQSLNKLAIVIGISAGIVGLVVTIIGVLVVMMIVGAMRHQQIDDQWVDQWPTEPAFLISAFVIGTLTLVAAGFVTGKVARREQVRHAVWAGGIILIINVVLTLIPVEGPSEPLWYDALTLLTTAPAVIAGGYLSTPRRS